MSKYGKGEWTSKPPDSEGFWWELRALGGGELFAQPLSVDFHEADEWNPRDGLYVQYDMRCHVDDLRTDALWCKAEHPPFPARRPSA